MTAIIKTEPTFDLRELYILRMRLLYASRPGKQEPEPDGSYFIGDVGETRFQDQRLQRDNPYSKCTGIRE